MNNIYRYSKVHDVSFDAQAIGAAHKDSFLMGAEYVLDNLLPRFKSVEDEHPEIIEPIVYVTKKGKVSTMSNRRLDDWFIQKYSVAYWMSVKELLSLLPL